MKKLIENYTFNPTTKEIVFLDYTTIDLERILIVTNVTINTIIYNFANSLQGGSIDGNVLTLNCNTSSMNNTDKLQIYYETIDTPSSEQTLQLLLTMVQNSDNSIQLIKRLLKILEPISTQDALQRQRVAVETIANMNVVSTVSTVSTVSNLGSVAGIDYRWLIIDQARNAYANGIRNNIQ